ncbi:hypothetical protein HK101_008951 [Irineochytrium annulatum]|nr:hypothetical protein HK101_008951 [Irineochytrium annulatum]
MPHDAPRLHKARHGNESRTNLDLARRVAPAFAASLESLLADRVVHGERVGSGESHVHQSDSSMATASVTVESLQRDLQLACEVGQRLLGRGAVLEASLTEADAIRGVMEEELSTAVQDLGEMRALVEESEELRALAEAQRDQAVLELKEIRLQARKATGAENEAASLRDKILSMTDQYEELEHSLQQKHTELNSVSIERQSLKDAVEEMHGQLDNFAEINAHLKESCGKQIAEYQQMISKLQEEKLALALETSELKQQLEKRDDATAEPGTSVKSATPMDSQLLARSVNTILADVRASAVSLIHHRESVDVAALRSTLIASERENTELLELVRGHQDTINQLEEERMSLLARVSEHERRPLVVGSLMKRASEVGIRSLRSSIACAGGRRPNTMAVEGVNTPPLSIPRESSTTQLERDEGNADLQGAGVILQAIADRSRLQQENAEMGAQLAAKDHAIAELTSRIDQLDSSRTTAVSPVVEAQCEKRLPDAYNPGLSSAIDTDAGQNTLAVDVQRKPSGSKIDSRAMRDTLINAVSQLSRHSLRLGSLQQNLRDAVRRKNDANDRYAVAVEARVACEMQIGEAGERMRALKRSSNVPVPANYDSVESLEEARGHFDEAVAVQMGEWAATARMFGVERDRLGAEGDAARGIVERMKNRIRGLQDEVEEAEKNVKTSGASIMEVIKEMAADTRTAGSDDEAEEAEAEEDSVKLKAALERAHIKEVTLNEALSSMGSQLAALTSKHDASDMQRRELEVANAALKRDNDDLRQELQISEKSLNVLRERLEKLPAARSDTKAAREDNHVTQAEEIKTAESLHMMRAELQALTARRDTAEMQARSFEMKAKSLRQVADDECRSILAKAGELETCKISARTKMVDENFAQMDAQEPTTQDLLISRLNKMKEVEQRNFMLQRENASLEDKRLALEMKLAEVRKAFVNVEAALEKSEDVVVNLFKDRANAWMVHATSALVDKSSISTPISPSSPSLASKSPASRLPLMRGSVVGSPGSEKANKMTKFFKKTVRSRAVSANAADEIQLKGPPGKLTVQTGGAAQDIETVEQRLANAYAETASLKESARHLESELRAVRRTLAEAVEEHDASLKAVALNQKEVEECLQTQVQELTDQLMVPSTAPPTSVLLKEVEELKTRLAESANRRSNSVSAAKYEEEIASLRAELSRSMTNLTGLRESSTSAMGGLNHTGAPALQLEDQLRVELNAATAKAISLCRLTDRLVNVAGNLHVNLRNQLDDGARSSFHFSERPKGGHIALLVLMSDAETILALVLDDLMGIATATSELNVAHADALRRVIEENNGVKRKFDEELALRQEAERRAEGMVTQISTLETARDLAESALQSARAEQVHIADVDHTTRLELHEKLTSLIKERTLARLESEDQRQRCEQLELKIRMQDAEIVKWRGETDELRQELATAKVAVEEIEHARIRQVEEAKATPDNLRQNFDEGTAELQSLLMQVRSDLDASSARVKTLTADAARGREKYQDMCQKNGNLERGIEKIAEELETARRVITTLTEELQTARTSLQLLEEANSTLVEAAASFEKERMDHASSSRSHEDAHWQSFQKIREYAEILVAKDTELAAAKEEIGFLQTKKIEQEAANARMKDSLQVSWSQNYTDGITRDRLTAEIAALKIDGAAASQELAVARQKIADYVKEVTILKKRADKAKELEEANEGLQSRNRAILKQLYEAREAYAILRTDAEKLEAHADAAEARCAEVEAELLKYKELYVEVHAANEGLGAAVAASLDFESENHSLSVAVAEPEDARSKSEPKLADLEEARVAACTNLNTVRSGLGLSPASELEEAQEKIRILQSDLSDRTATVDILQLKLTELNAFADEANSRCAAVEAELVKYKLTNDEVMSANEGLGAAVAASLDLESQNESLCETVAGLKDDLRESTERLSQLEDARAADPSDSGQLTEARKEIRDLQRDLADREARIELLKLELAASSQAHETELIDTKAAVTRMAVEAKSSKNEAQELKEAYEASKLQATELVAKLSIVTARADVAETDLASVRAEHDTLSNEVQRLTEMLVSSEKEMDRIEAELTTSVRGKEEAIARDAFTGKLQYEVAGASSRTSELDKLLLKSVTVGETLEMERTAQLAETASAAQSLESDLANATDEAAALRTEIGAAYSQIKALEERVQASNVRHATDMVHRAVSKKQIKSLEDLLAASRANVHALSGIAAESQGSLAALNTSLAAAGEASTARDGVIERLEAQVIALQERLDDLESQRFKAVAALETICAKIEHLHADASTVQLNAATIIVEAPGTRCSSTQTPQDTMIDDLRTQLRNREDEILDLRRWHAEAEAELVASQSSLTEAAGASELELALAEAESERDRLLVRLLTSTDRLASTHDDVGADAAEVDELREQVRSREEECIEVRGWLAEAEEELGRVTGRLKESEEELGAARGTLEALALGATEQERDLKTAEEGRKEATDTSTGTRKRRSVTEILTKGLKETVVASDELTAVNSPLEKRDKLADMSLEDKLQHQVIGMSDGTSRSSLNQDKILNFKQHRYQIPSCK